MKREILFRGFSTDSGEWVEGFLVQTKTHTYIIQPGWYNDDLFISLYNITDKVYPETVGQFTGLTDKNGKKIFEGDVFKFPDEIFESYYTSCGTEYNSWEIENYGVVGYDEYYGRYDFVQYRFENNAVEADLHENQDIDFADFVRELEVFGNIHDSPELLEGGVEDGNL